MGDAGAGGTWLSDSLLGCAGWAGWLELQKPPKPASLRAGQNWESRDRWRMLFKGRWRKREGIAVSELRCLTILGRHLSKTRANWHHRYLMLSDSLAAGGAAAKGRSSVFGMLMQCRQLLVLSVVYGIRIITRWIPSYYNNADHPSRGGPVGVAPDTRRQHIDQARQLDDGKV